MNLFFSYNLFIGVLLLISRKIVFHKLWERCLFYDCLFTLILFYAECPYHIIPRSCYDQIPRKMILAMTYNLIMIFEIIFQLKFIVFTIPNFNQFIWRNAYQYVQILNLNQTINCPIMSFYCSYLCSFERIPNYYISFKSSWC